MGLNSRDGDGAEFYRTLVLSAGFVFFDCPSMSICPSIVGVKFDLGFMLFRS